MKINTYIDKAFRLLEQLLEFPVDFLLVSIRISQSVNSAAHVQRSTQIAELGHQTLHAVVL
jgi:hypothetical protein